MTDKNTTTEVVVTDQTQMTVMPAPETESTRVLAMIENALESGKDIETMVRMYERVMDRSAKQAYAAAMVRVQQAIPPIFAGSENTQTNSKYAKYEVMHKILAPIYTAEGFAISYSEGDSPLPEHYRILAQVSHRDGHSETHHIDLPLDNKGIKGQVNKTGVHGKASTISYGKRYLEAGIFSVAFTDEDDDGVGGGAETITPEQADELLKLVQETETDIGKFLKMLRIGDLIELPVAGFDGARLALLTKLGAKHRQEKASKASETPQDGTSEKA